MYDQNVREIADLCLPYLRKYARHIGVDIIARELAEPLTMTEKYSLAPYAESAGYSAIAFVDVDVLVNTTRNIFHEHEHVTFAAKTYKKPKGGNYSARVLKTRTLIVVLSSQSRL